MNIDETLVSQNTERLRVIYETKIKEFRKKIEVLHDKFHKRAQDRIFKTRYETAFGFFLSEYVFKLPVCTLESSIDKVLLNVRRLCEAFITVKYINQQNAFEKMVAYCERDRWEYLEGCSARTEADEKLFPELKDMPDMNQPNREELAKLKQKYEKKPAKMPSMKEMAQAVGLEDEYNYFYKFTSKLLHFCPFSLNGDSPFEAPVHKIIFLMRIERYLEKIKEELDIVYQKTKLTN
ncbi:DUF5677 domain-containing protein [Candidatus Proelusimicrobium excrementi]|uniref:DUF5677 domain-containing protein n=1 Tax=Candidatus Proelusimicrobium excrementi TaxID=3416222 RepID=UPI003C8AFC30|nr:hypothetical protein [Elusimicrobiaceae bacterium]